MLQNNDLITVLMPAYNAGPYIHEAVDSILQQTFTNFEFLIVNDGSKDNTLDVLKKYNDPRIKIIDQKNKGLIATLNEAIDIAQGNIIARMDADDVCLPQRLELQYKFLKEHPEYVMVGSEADVTDKDGNFLMRLKPVGHTNEEINERINNKCPFIHPCVTFRKDAVIKAGKYPRNALTFEDHLLWKQLLEIGKVHNLHEVLLQVRFNPESVTIDEKWRGKDFLDIRKRSVRNGFIADDDAVLLRKLISSQNLGEYKQASYYAMVGKKYLWDNPNSSLARKNFKEAIRHYPKHAVTYLLYLFSFVPAPFRKFLYQIIKRK
jgi:glycosyltransferase involved in cell wall biosynthesis